MLTDAYAANESGGGLVTSLGKAPRSGASMSPAAVTVKSRYSERSRETGPAKETRGRSNDCVGTRRAGRAQTFASGKGKAPLGPSADVRLGGAG